MTEEVFTKNVKRIENIYSELIKGETNPQKEVEMRVDLIDALSNLEASLYSEKEKNQEFITLLAKLRETLLNWDPYGQWFRHQKELVDTVYEVIVKAKNVVFTKSSNSAEEATRLKTELTVLKNELNELRSLMSSLLQQTSSEQQAQQVQPPQQAIKKIEGALESLETKEEERTSTITPSSPPSEQQIEPPLILPLEQEQKVAESKISEPIETKVDPETSAIENTTTSSPPEPETIVSKETLEKLAKPRSLEEQPSTILGKMKEILSEAEEETEKQMADFRGHLKPAQEEIAAPVVENPAKTQPASSEEVASTLDRTENAFIEALVETAPEPEPAKQPSRPERLETESDPYMQLLTLEAEKYRLEKESEKNEIDFQEGLKSKQEFDETIVRINSELTTIREQIAALRKQLTI
ncbi:MAG: hypothetical protein K9W42_03375 [Candidatus Heimdallarchaeota archaeon]|nr:hypothetical protein [Candidatus Heimdallarchaeota archaeon]